jgi:hypothetical protein
MVSRQYGTRSSVKRKYKNVCADVINVSVVAGNILKYDGVKVQLNLNYSYYSWNFGTRK